MWTLFISISLLAFPFLTHCQDTEYVEIKASQLPDESHPPTGNSDARIHALIEQLKNANNLQDTYAVDLNSEAVQLAIAEQNPYLMSLMPPSITLHQRPMQVMAKKIYRFDYFIPPTMRNQPSVRSAFKENSKIYPKDLNRYINETKESMLNSAKATLLHPDFFYTPEFVKFAMTNCHESRRDQWRVKDQKKTIEKVNATYAIYQKRKTFDHQHKLLFLQVQIPHDLNVDCYPLDFLEDVNFVIQMEQKYPHSNFLVKAYDRTKNPAFREEVFRRKAEDVISSWRFPGNISELTQEELASSAVQNVLFRNLGDLKALKLPIPFQADVVENFIAKRYKPERFFNDEQKKNSAIKTLLEKYKNDSPELLLQEKDRFLRDIKSKTCCGTPASKNTYELFLNLPSELIQDIEIHKTALSITRSQDTYLEQLARVTDYPQSLKDYLTNPCQKGMPYDQLTWDHGPKNIKEDKVFFDKLEACRKEINEASKAAQSRPQPEPQPTTPVLTISYRPTSTTKTKGNFYIGMTSYRPAAELRLKGNQIESNTMQPLLISPNPSDLMMIALKSELSQMGVKVSEREGASLQAEISSFKYTENEKSVHVEMTAKFTAKKDRKICYAHGMQITKAGSTADKVENLIQDLYRMHIELFVMQEGYKKCL